MILPLLAILVFGGLGLLCLFAFIYGVKEGEEDLGGVFVMSFLPFIIIALLFSSYITIDGTIAEMEVEAVALENQYEYLLNLDVEKEYIAYLGMEEIYKDTFVKVRNYNEKIARKQALNDNVWIGLFIPKQWDNLEQIDLRKGE